jgi:FO synthase
MEAAIRAIGRSPRQRTTLYGDAPPERVAASFGAPPLSEPVNPPANEAGLKPLPVLDRPGLEAVSA